MPFANYIIIMAVALFGLPKMAADEAGSRLILIHEGDLLW